MAPSRFRGVPGTDLRVFRQGFRQSRRPARQGGRGPHYRPKVRLPSQPWHIYSGVIARRILAASTLGGGAPARRKDCAPLAGKSTLNRLERGGPELTRYHRIAWDGAKIEALFVELFLDAHQQPPKQIILDLDATDDPLHGHQEGRFFHGYYDCYCYLPLYVFCGRHLLLAKLRPSDIDAAAGSIEAIERIVRQIRARWPRTRILLRADSGFAREDLMAWCEGNGVDFLFGLARNE